MKSYFPIKIIITNTKEIKICNSTYDIPSGKGFKVLQTNIKLIS